MDANSVIIGKEVVNPIVTYMNKIPPESIVTGLFVLLGVYIASKLALRAYFKQRAHEQIMKRYLDEGIDRVLAGVNQAFRVFIYNNLKAQTLLAKVQKGKSIDTTVRFQSVERHILELTPYSKINHLVGDYVFWEVSQLLLGLVEGQNVVLNEHFEVMSVVSTFEKMAPGEINQLLDNYYKKFVKFYSLAQELQCVASILEKQTTLSWDKFNQLKNHSEVKTSVKRLKATRAEIKLMQV
jgi:hypothetical protein